MRFCRDVPSPGWRWPTWNDSSPRGRAAESTLRKLAENPKTTEILLQVFSTSQHFSELLIRDPALIDWLQGGAERRDREALIDDLWSTLREAQRESEQSLAIRRFRLRETLRIGYNDIVRGVPLEVTTLDLSNLADACIEAATRLARQWAESRFGSPRRRDGEPARFVVLGLGKLGGTELNYSSDIDLVFLYDEDGADPRAARRLERRVLRPDGHRDRPAAGRAHRDGQWPTASTCGFAPTASRVPWPGRSMRPWAIT